MNDLDDLLLTARKAIRVFDAFRIAHHLTGGLAVTAYAIPRTTQDIDFVLDRESLHAQLVEVAAALEPDFYVDTGAIRDALKRRGMFQLLDRETSFKIDCYVRELIQGELIRSETHELYPGWSVRIVSHEDAILAKLLWVQKGSYRSRRDVQWLTDSLPSQRRAALRPLAGSLGVLELWDTVLNDKEPTE